MARIFCEIWPFRKMKIGPIAYFWQICFQILPISSLGLRKSKKAFKNCTKWRNYAKSSHTVCHQHHVEKRKSLQMISNSTWTSSSSTRAVIRKCHRQKKIDRQKHFFLSRFFDEMCLRVKRRF